MEHVPSRTANYNVVASDTTLGLRSPRQYRKSVLLRSASCYRKYLRNRAHSSLEWGVLPRLNLGLHELNVTSTVRSEKSAMRAWAM